MTEAARIPANEVYYYEIGEGRWQGQFHFQILDWPKFMAANLPLQDRGLAAFLHFVEKVPGEAKMIGEIACDPSEGPSGVARVDVSVERFGLEIYRLRGYYRLEPDGVGVRIKIYQRFGPHGSWLQNEKLATAEILEEGLLGVYYMRIFGEDWIGRYRLDERRLDLSAEYDCPWGVTRELMSRRAPIKPQGARTRLRWETMLDVARRLETRDRTYEVAGDPRALFTYVYGVVSRTIAFSMAEQEYDDADWVVALARAFASRYEKALDDEDAGCAPEAWCLVFDAMRSKRLSGIAEVMLCIYVHVLHDLPLALLDVGLEDPDGRTRSADYDRMNGVLSSTIDLLQHRLAARYNPAFWVMDILGARHDEALSSATVEQMRTTAWYTAERLRDGAQYDVVMQQITEKARSLVDEVNGRTRTRRLLGRALHGGVRLFRRSPRYPSVIPGELERQELRPPHERHDRVDRSENVLYGLHTAIGQRRHDHLEGSLADLPNTLKRTPLAARHRFVVDHLATPRTWASARAAAAKDAGLRWRVGALLVSLDENDGATIVPRDLEIDEPQTNAIRALHSAMASGLERGFDKVQDELASVMKTLDAVGIPASATLGGFDDLRAHYDRDTKLFVAEVPTLFRRKFEDVRWLIEPENWTELIPHMVRADWVEGPDADRRGVVREVVNVYHPWIDDHPLVLENDLRVHQEDTADRRTIHYELDKSIDGSLARDFGHIELSRIDNDASLLIIKKQIEVIPDRNPLLYALLRANPDGLAYLFTYWVNTVAARYA